MYICTPLRAISSAGSEHLVYTEGVGGSNPSSPTIRDKEEIFCFVSFLFLSIYLFMCKVLQVINGSYYWWNIQTITAIQQRKNTTREQIKFICFASKQWYESLRITIEIQSFGYEISRITTAKYFKHLDLRNKLS